MGEDPKTERQTGRQVQTQHFNNKDCDGSKPTGNQADGHIKQQVAKAQNRKDKQTGLKAGKLQLVWCNQRSDNK